MQQTFAAFVDFAIIHDDSIIRHGGVLDVGDTIVRMKDIKYGYLDVKLQCKTVDNDEGQDVFASYTLTSGGGNSTQQSTPSYGEGESEAGPSNYRNKGCNYGQSDINYQIKQVGFMYKAMHKDYEKPENAFQKP